jgi:hypothetical protein
VTSVNGESAAEGNVMDKMAGMASKREFLMPF